MMDIHLRMYELTQKLNKLLTSNNVAELPQVLKERGALIASLEGVSPPSEELCKKIIDLENKNDLLFKALISKQEESIKELELNWAALLKYRSSNKLGKLIDISQ